MTEKEVLALVTKKSEQNVLSMAEVEYLTKKRPSRKKRSKNKFMNSLVDECRAGKVSAYMLAKLLKIPRCNVCDQIDPILNSYVNIATVDGYAISVSSIKNTRVEKTFETNSTKKNLFGRKKYIVDCKPATLFEITNGKKISKNKAIKITSGELIPKGANAVVKRNDKDIIKIVSNGKFKRAVLNETKKDKISAIKIYKSIKKYTNIKSKRKATRIAFDDYTFKTYDLKGEPKKESRKTSYIKDHPQCSRCGIFFNGTHAGGKEEQSWSYRMVSAKPGMFYCNCEKCSHGQTICVWCVKNDKTHIVKTKRGKK